MYYSQYNQDKILNTRIFKNKKNGFFIDIGAHDGITYSNSYFFEKELEWTGICVEPNPSVFKQLQKNRKCTLINKPAWIENKKEVFFTITGHSEMLSGLYDTYHPKHLKRIKSEIDDLNQKFEITEVECFDLNEYLIKNSINNIDFISLDTEGSEFKILKNIDFSQISIKVIVIEIPYDQNEVINFLENKNFYLYAYAQNSDLIFVNNSYKF